MALRYIYLGMQMFDVPDGWVCMDIGSECPEHPGEHIEMTEYKKRFRCSLGLGRDPRAAHCWPTAPVYFARPVMQLENPDGLASSRLRRAPRVQGTFPIR